MPYAHITGWGMAVPEPVLTNADLSRMVDTNDEWIREHSGIRERRIAHEQEFPPPWLFWRPSRRWRSRTSSRPTWT